MVKFLSFKTKEISSVHIVRLSLSVCVRVCVCVCVRACVCVCVCARECMYLRVRVCVGGCIFILSTAFSSSFHMNNNSCRWPEKNHILIILQ